MAKICVAVSTSSLYGLLLPAAAYKGEHNDGLETCHRHGCGGRRRLMEALFGHRLGVFSVAEVLVVYGSGMAVV
jgi:hypothetical protein